MHQSVWKTVYVVTTIMGIVTTAINDSPCHQEVYLEDGQTINNDVIPFPVEREHCLLEMRTKAEWRVVITFHYQPSVAAHARVADDCAQAPEYLLLGNDYTAIGEELLTSYKYCRETLGEQIVSRDSYLWLMVKESGGDHQNPTLRLSFNATTMPQVTCNDTEMECSPVQCVPDSSVCDGHRDCFNGLDEYCYNFNNLKLLADKDLSQERQLLPSEGSTCFLCRDGTCITPRQPRYGERWGVWWWYLCDGVKHCPDGWDEQEYMCYLKEHFPERAHTQVFQCEAFDLPPSVRRQVSMWILGRCDERRDCREEGEEEEGKASHNCGVLRDRRRSEADSKLTLDPLALSLVIVFVVIVIISAVLVVRCFEKGQASNSRRNHILRRSDRSSPDSSTELQSCLSVKHRLVVDTNGSNTLFPVSDLDFQRLRETTV